VSTGRVDARPVPSWVDRELYPFEARWLELEREGTLHYVDEDPAGGGAGTVVFCHGTPAWSFDWRGLIAALSPTHRCVALDHLGFGLSERPWGAEYTPEAHARVVELPVGHWPQEEAPEEVERAFKEFLAFRS